MKTNFTPITDNTEKLFKLFNKVYSKNKEIFMFSSNPQDIYEIMWQLYINNKDSFSDEVNRVVVLPENRTARQYCWLNDNRIVFGVREETIEGD